MALTFRDIDLRLNESEVRKLASIANFPKEADLGHFGDALKDAARRYIVDSRVANENQVHREIFALHKAAVRRDFQALERSINTLSDEARHFLATKADIPSPAVFREPLKRELAADLVERLCVVGGKIQIRKRPNGRTYKTIVWRMAGPKPTRTPQKRRAERDFAMWLQIAYLEAAGHQPGLTAHHDNRGPFSRLLRRCLDLLDAKHVEEVELINSLQHLRKEQERLEHTARNRSRKSNP
jgi:hypothetical protein